MSNSVDITIVGAGVVGLAMAATLAREDREIYVLEQHDTFGKEITSRSGASTHVAWFPPVPGDPLKYKLCAWGRHKLWEVVDKYEIPYFKKSKLFAIIDEEDYGLLQEFLERGLRQGAEARMLSKEEIKKIEPDLNYPAAIFIPETRKLDIIALLRCYVLQAIERGAHLAYKSKVIGIEKVADGYEVTVDGGTETMTFTTRLLINCAGLGSEKIAQLVGIDTTSAGYELTVNDEAQGGYTVGNGKTLSCTIEPAPVWKGPFVSYDVDGQMTVSIGGFSERHRLTSSETHDALIKRFSAIYENDVAGPQNKQSLYDSVKDFLPFLELDDLYAGAMIGGVVVGLEGYTGLTDWIIREESDKGLPGFVNLIGMDSPAFTSSLAIAEYVSGLLEDQL